MLFREFIRASSGLATFIVPLILMATEPDPRPDVVLTDHGRAVHSTGLLFDGHNDLPWEIRKSGQSTFDRIDISQRQPQLHTDIPRLREGGVKAQFWSVYVPADTSSTGESVRCGRSDLRLCHFLTCKSIDQTPVTLFRFSSVT